MIPKVKLIRMRIHFILNLSMRAINIKNGSDITGSIRERDAIKIFISFI